MRANGYTEWYYGKPYTMLNVNDQKYWTMGDPINKDGKPCTILINTKLIDSAGMSHYNYIADGYDSAFDCDFDYADTRSEDYVGVDVSWKMLCAFGKKHGIVNTVNARFEDFYIDRKFDLVVSLFGSFSYIKTEYLGKVLLMKDTSSMMSLS